MHRNGDEMSESTDGSGFSEDLKGSLKYKLVLKKSEFGKPVVI